MKSNEMMKKITTSCKILNAVLRDQKRISRTRRKWQDEQD